MVKIFSSLNAFLTANNFQNATPLVKKELLDTNFVTCYHGFSTPVYNIYVVCCVFVSLNLSQASKGEREENQAVRDEPASDLLENNWDLIKFF